MPTGVRGTADFYKERYGLGDRLAVRLAALLAHKVDLSAAAIECLADSPPLRHVLLHPQLLELAPTLETAKLRSLVLPGEELPAAFVITEAKGWRTIALEEELLAEQGTEGEEAHLPALAARAEVLHPAEIADLFTRRDIAELELILRTSAEPKEKITAIRRLALSPASDREKVALFATALTDRDALVRSEAADALTTLGLAPEVAEAARSLAEGNERQRRFAAQRLGRRFADAGETEMGVLLRIVAGTLRYEPLVEVRRPLIRAVEGACRTVARDPQSIRDLIRVLAAQLRDAAEDLGAEVRRVLLMLGHANPAEVYRSLQQELATIPDRRIRRPLIAVAAELARPKDERGEACRQALGEIAASSDPAVECLQLFNALGRMGEAVVAAVGERLLDAPEAAQGAFVQLLDAVATRPRASRAAKAKIARLFLQALQRGQRAARLAVINALGTVDQAIPASIRRDLAAELLACLPEYANPAIVAAIETTVGKLGAPALQPVLAVLGRGQRPRQRASAARILGDLVPRLSEGDAAEARRAIDEAVRLLDGGFPDRATLARMLGQMCTGPAPDEAALNLVVEVLRGHILDKQVSHAALDGLGRLCLSPRAAPALKVELASFFGRLLDRELPEIEPTSSTHKDEIVYTLGSEVTAYTELVPGIATGLRNIAATSGGVLRERALERLLRAWRDIAAGTLQLGPGNTELLLSALHTLGTLADIDPGQREAIADAVALRRDYLPAYRVLAELVVAAGGAMAGRAAALADELLERVSKDKQLAEGEQAIVLETLVRLATSAALGRGTGELRERVADAVIEADRRELACAADQLARLHDSPAIPARVRRRLADRLAARGGAQAPPRSP